MDRGADVEARISSGATPLLIALRMRHLGAAGVLLKAGADFGACDKDGWNALLTAASAGTESMVRELLDRGADVEVTNVAGETALSVAANASVTRALEQADCLQRWHRRANLALWRRACGWR
uniref:Ankyrin repeat domain-containing protein n=1 Tax=Cafeteria roenbergensis TaxID=33653 RepID=A0A7S0JST7_CAFRO